MNRRRLRNRGFDGTTEIRFKRRVARNIRRDHINLATDGEIRIVQQCLQIVASLRQSAARLNHERLATFDRRDGVGILRERRIELAALSEHVAHLNAHPHKPLRAHKPRTGGYQRPVGLLGRRNFVEQLRSENLFCIAIIVLRKMHLGERHVGSKPAKKRLAQPKHQCR